MELLLFLLHFINDLMLYYSNVYIINIFFDADIDDSPDARDDITISEIFWCDFAHLFDETFKILKAILIILKFIHNGNDSSLKGIMTFSIWNWDYFSSADFPVRFSDFAVGRDERLWDFRDYFFLSGLHMW